MSQDLTLNHSSQNLDEPWLVIVDMQNIFGDPHSAWFTPRFAEIIEPIQALMSFTRPRICFTRFLAPVHPVGSWIPYYQQWPFALQPDNSRDYQLVDEFSGEEGLRVEATTFGKWIPKLDAAIPMEARILLVGVSTDCCVLSTALAAADQGRHVQVVSDACAGVNDISHNRALDVLRLYQPLIEVVKVSNVLTSKGRVSQ